MKAPTELQLRAMTPEQRMLVRSRAVKIGGEIGNATVALIDSLHLPLSSGGMTLDHPLYREMQEIIWSVEGKALAIEAAANGFPAMAGVDPLLQKMMPERYGREYQGTMNAGHIVADLMRFLGYEKVGDAALPSGCVAKTAALWSPNKKRSEA
jgi:hypothetical protein